MTNGSELCGATSVRVLLGVALLVATVAVLAGTAPVLGGDSPAVIQPAADDHEVEPGGTVTVDAMVSSHGGFGDVGVESITLVAEYNASVLSVEEVDPGEWMAQGEETDIETAVDVDADAGTVSVEQWRDPHLGGAEGYASFAAITFEVDGEATAGNTSVSFDDSEVMLTSGFQQVVFGHNATIEIVGGDGDGGVPGAKVGGDGIEDDEGDGGDGWGPGVWVLAGLGGVFVVGVVGFVGLRVWKGE